MEGSIMGIWVAHREGFLYCPDDSILNKAERLNLVPLAFVDDDCNQTETYPYNPNGSPKGFTALCSPDGRHLAMMPHPERSFMFWQWPWIPRELKQDSNESPWLKMFQNARRWCEER